MNSIYVASLFILVGVQNVSHCYAENVSKTTVKADKAKVNKDRQLNAIIDHKSAAKALPNNKTKFQSNYSLSQPYDTNNPPPSGTRIDPVSSNAH